MTGSTDAMEEQTTSTTQSSMGLSTRQQQNPPSLPQLPQQPLASSRDDDKFAQVFMNMALYDPPKWGWTALGGIADVLTPHERSRRNSTCRAYKNKRRILKRQRKSIATKPIETAIKLKDPPKYPTTTTTITKEISSSSSISMEQQQPTLSEPLPSSSSLSCDEPSSMVVSETTPQQQQQPPQTMDESNSESKTIADATTISNPIASETEKGKDSSCATGQEQQPQQRLDSSADAAEGKPQNPLDSETTTTTTTIQPSDKTKESIEKSCPPVETPIIPPKEEPPKIDIGMETIGISTSVLGMKVQKQGLLQQSAAATTEANNNNDEHQEDDNNAKTADANNGRKSKKYKSKSRRSVGGSFVSRTKYDCHVLGMDNAEGNNTDMVLDMYAYHQGREGMEARDAETGELLYTQQVTDTNHDFDAPKSTFPMEIEFPLEDDEDDDEFENIGLENDLVNNTKALDSQHKTFESGHENKTATERTESSTGKSSKTKSIAMYRETLTWDLLDPNTPTPLAFASSIGEEYGLSFGQTMDLAARIDKQIQKHVTETSHYREPIATKEPMQELTEPRKLGPIRQPYRFDEVVKTGKEGGTFKPKKGGRGIPKPRSSFSAPAEVSKKNQNKTGRSSLAPSSESANTTKAPSSDRRDKNKKKDVDTSQVSLEDELSDELLDEVRRRSRLEPIGINDTVLKPEKNAICHICKKRCAVGYHFPCSTNNHVYCESHVQSRLGITKESGVYRHDSCPICTLACECAKCVRKVKNVATLLKAKSIEQKKKLHDVDFPDILNACRNTIPQKELSRATDVVLEKKIKEIRRKREEVERRKQEKMERLANDADKKSQKQQIDKTPDKKSRTIQLAGQTMVPRPPLSDFPRELHDGIDFDATATDAYFTAYSADGKKSVNDVPDVWLDDEKRTKPGTDPSQLSRYKYSAEVQEDGNVDYCHICKTAGHLILCDFCPRGFHHDCLRNDNQLSPKGNHWECFVCKNEKLLSDKDFVDGKESIDAISRAFLDLDATDERALVGLEVLSIIHQMLTNLVDYDFGYTFSQPVDVPGYTDVVKRPMDIGTICSKLVNGEFSKLLKGNFSMDELVAKVLNDIELIWRNCIMFNVIGSSVARMALVLRRRVKNICRRSIFSKLSDGVKKNVMNYARKFDEAWASGITASLSKESDDESLADDNWKLSAIENLQPRSDLKFTAKPTNGRSVAVLDSVSGRVVKLYSSPKSASKAVEMILKSGHRCEWNASAERTDLNLKLIADRSKNDPNSLLFGYRWLFLDDLNDGSVTFLKTVHDVIEVRHDEFMFVFRSIEEALSSFHLAKTADINDLRKKLVDLPRDGHWSDIEGVKWRRPMTSKEQPDSQKTNDFMTSAEEDTEMGPNLVSDSDSLPSWKNCAFLKRDLVTDQFLVGFDSIQLAHEDWMQSALSSPSFPSSEAQTMENFKKYYLDGDRNIDGMIWQTGDNSRKMELEGKKENTNNENFSHVMEVEDNGNGENVLSESTRQGEKCMLGKSKESRSQSTGNESSSPSFNTFAMTNNERVASENPSAMGKLDEPQNVLGKRKHLHDDDETDIPPSKKPGLSIVFVE